MATDIIANSIEETMRTADPAAAQMLELAKEQNILTAWDRYKAQQPQCKFGLTGICCRICLQGPCRIIPTKAGAQRGICGADIFTIVARNTVRYMAAGASAHSDHGREIAFTLKGMTEGHAPDYKVTDEAKLARVAKKFDIPTEGRDANAIARDIAVLALEDFGKYDNKPARWLWAGQDDERKKKYTDTGLTPSAIDRAVVQLMHQTHMGVDADPVNIIFGGLQTCLADYTGQSLATDLSDILFGTPVPIVTEANLAVLKKEKVNIAVHGHNPLLSEMVVFAARELEEEAKAAGAGGINIVGICCTGNEVLMREGVPTVTNFASQELAIMTGVLDTMVVDVQCIMPSVRETANCYHTTIVTTSNIAKIPGSVHVNFNEGTAMEDAKRIVRAAIEQFSKRDPKKACIPDFKKQVVGGFSMETMENLFSKLNPTDPMKALGDAITSGQLKGVAAFIGCNNQKTVHDGFDLHIAREMAKNDVFILATGCSAGAFAKAGFLSYEGVKEYAGPGLKKFIDDMQAANPDIKAMLPLAYHMGSCVDNSRLTEFWTKLAKAMDCTVPELPFVGVAAEAMSEKAVSIGSWFITMGIPTHVGVMPPVNGSQMIYEICTKIAADVFGGYFILETEREPAVTALLRALDNRNWRLKVHKKVAEKYGSKQVHSYEAF